MVEVELGVKEVETSENVYTQQPATSDENQKKLMMVDKGASTVSSGGNLVQSLEDSAMLSAEEMRVNATTQFQNDQAQLLTDTIEFTAVNNPEQLQPLVEQAPQLFEEIAQSGESKLTAHRAWVDTLDGSENLSKEDKDRIAVDALLLESIASGMDKRAWWQTGWDILGLMAVPDESYNAAEIQAQLLGESTGVTEWLESGDAFRNIGEFRNTLTPEHRVMFDERLVEIIQNVDDNQLQQVGAVMAILGRDSFTESFQALEKAELALIGSGIGKGLLRGLRSLNVVNRLGKAGDKRTAMKTAEVATADPQAAREVGVTQVDAASVGNPVKPRGIFTGAPEGLQKEYRLYAGDVTEALRKAEDTLLITTNQGSKDADEVAASVRKNLAKNDDIDNIVVEQASEGLRISYDVLDENSVVTKNEFKLFTLDDVGGLEQKEAGFIASGLRPLTSPNTVLGTDRKFFVQQAEAALFARSRLQKGYSDAVDLALKPVNGNKKSLQKIDVVMKQLDGTDESMSYHNLVNVGVGGQKLNDKEFIAITGLRRVLDDAWHTNNLTLRREMELRGTKAVDIDGETQYAKPYDDADSAYTVFSGDTDNQIIRLSDSETAKGMGLDELKQAYSQGKVLVRNDGANELEWFESTDGFVKYALVDADEVSELPSIVLNRVKNYLPKLREDANYFVKQKRGTIINGKTQKREVTVAFGATEAQARRYLERVRQTAIDAGEEFIDDDWSIKFDREVSSGSPNSDVLRASGGLVRGKRKSTELDYAGDFDEGNRTDTLDSLQRYMNITADKYAMSEWRLEARTRVINEAASVDTIGAKANTADWGELRALIENANMEPQRKAKLLSAYDQTSTMSMLPTKSDQVFQGAVRAVGKKFDRAGQEQVAKFIYRMHDKSLVDILKSGTFNLTLGMFNLVQIPVQMLGASVAASINPVAFTKGSPRWLMASTLDFVTDEKSAKAFLSKVARDHDIDANTLRNDYEAWRKSGMYESVVRGNADASSISNRLPYDSGFLRKGFNQALELGQVPYRMGELSNMRISFFTALEREKGLKGKSFQYDDATIARVVARAEQYRLNMSGGNKAAFQKGIWALPTQFKQIYTKYLEALTGTHFNNTEKARLILGQATLFGSAGVPMLDYAIDSVVNNVYDYEEGELTSEELILARRGALGWLLNHEYDVDALISGRLTVNADVVADLNKAFFDTKTPMIATMLGPSFITGDKAIDFIKNMNMAGGMIIDDALEGEELTPVMKEAAIIMSRSLAGLSSSGRKWMAAYDLSEGWVRKSDGMPLYSVEPELGDIVARAVGFGSQEMDDLYKLYQADYKRKDKIRDLTNRYISIIHDLDTGIKAQSELQVEAAQMASTLITRQIEREHPEDAREIMRMVQNRLASPRDFREKVLRDSLLNSLGELTDAANKTSIEKQKFIEENNLGGQ